MEPSTELHRWAGGLCLGVVAALVMLGYHFGNVRFVPMAAGFAILAGLFYSGRLISTPPPSLSNSGQHRAL
jgi:hypothetical protein